MTGCHDQPIGDFNAMSVPESSRFPNVTFLSLSHPNSEIMALISAFTVIRTLSVFHITLAFYFLTNPRALADQNIVYLLGEAMELVNTTPFRLNPYLTCK
jgi:hypothetical protein